MTKIEGPPHHNPKMMILFMFLTISAFSTASDPYEQLDPKRFIVHGPGVTNKYSLPVQYFFIQPVDGEGENITSPFTDTFHLQFLGKSKAGGHHCRIRTEQIEKSDGVVILRYRPVVTCEDVQLVVKWRNEHVGESPYRLEESLYPENCYCPQNFIDYLDSASCPTVEEQIDKDLNAFKTMNYSKVREALLDQFKNSRASAIAVCQYVVKSNQVFRQCFGQHVGFKMFIDSLLLSMTRKMLLPDFEIFVNLGDWPVMKKGGQSRTSGPKPIFSWCGSDDSYDIVMPTYDLTESTIDNMDRVTLDILSAQKHRVPWEQKVNKAFWRGRDARRERLDLVDLSRAHPELINASLTNFFFFRDEEEKYGKAPYISFFKFFDYKYSLNIDGTVAAYRLPYLLSGDSLLMKQESPFYEHFYKKMVPNEHFVPFKRDLSNLVNQIKWAMDNEELVQRIIRNANEFVNENLLPRNIFCYYVLLFKEWSQLQNGEIRMEPDMERVTGNTDMNCNCKRMQVGGHDEL